ncbi:MAG: hypothetical protein J7577_00925 [Sphingobacteriaceae bacterium]|nr:hypothetical protein [Sphingobacteriaceae bacterium]
MRRRRELDLRYDIEDVVKSKGKGLLGWLIKGLLSALVDAILNMLKEKQWVELPEEEF